MENQKIIVFSTKSKQDWWKSTTSIYHVPLKFKYFFPLPRLGVGENKKLFTKNIQQICIASSVNINFWCIENVSAVQFLLGTSNDQSCSEREGAGDRQESRNSEIHGGFSGCFTWFRGISRILCISDRSLKLLCHCRSPQRRFAKDASIQSSTSSGSRKTCDDICSWKQKRIQIKNTERIPFEPVQTQNLLRRSPNLYKKPMKASAWLSITSVSALCHNPVKI